VRAAPDGRTALEVCASFEPQVVLLDIGLPDMDGYEVARRIRGTVPGQGALLLAVTGWGQLEDKRRSAEAGFDEHLTKPVEFAFLSRLLATRRRC
jgi:CheY-like chemotaxis protein